MVLGAIQRSDNKHVDDDTPVFMFGGTALILWPITIPLAFLMLAALVFAQAGSTLFYVHKINIEQQLKKKMREEAKIKQDKLMKKLGD